MDGRHVERHPLPRTAENQELASRQTFNAALDAYLQGQQLYAAPRSYRTDKQRGQALRKAFGAVRLRRFTSEMIMKFQVDRRADGISNRTINMEVGLLRRVLKRYRQWSRLADEVRMLPEQAKEARILSPDEEKLRETAAQRPVWIVARCAAVLALNTTMRGCELRGLRWHNVDLFERVLRIRRETTKTDAGDRVIPLNRDALQALVELRERGQARHLGAGPLRVPGLREPPGRSNTADGKLANGLEEPDQGFETGWSEVSRPSSPGDHQARRVRLRRPDHHEHRRPRLEEDARTLLSHPAASEAPRPGGAGDAASGAGRRLRRAGDRDGELGGSVRGYVTIHVTIAARPTYLRP